MNPSLQGPRGKQGTTVGDVDGETLGPTDGTTTVGDAGGETLGVAEGGDWLADWDVLGVPDKYIAVTSAWVNSFV